MTNSLMSHGVSFLLKERSIWIFSKKNFFFLILMKKFQKFDRRGFTSVTDWTMRTTNRIVELLFHGYPKGTKRTIRVQFYFPRCYWFRSTTMGKKSRTNENSLTLKKSSSSTYQQDPSFEYLTKTFNRQDGPIPVGVFSLQTSAFLFNCTRPSSGDVRRDSTACGFV